jgi:hypothetical protein
MPSKHIDFDAVRELARALTEVGESTIHGAPALKVRSKLLACPAIHRSAEPDTLAVRISLEQRAELMAARPDLYYVTDHYVNHPCVLVRLERIDRRSLRELLRMGWHFVTAKAPVKRKPPRQAAAR